MSQVMDCNNTRYMVSKLSPENGIMIKFPSGGHDKLDINIIKDGYDYTVTVEHTFALCDIHAVQYILLIAVLKAKCIKVD